MVVKMTSSLWGTQTSCTYQMASLTGLLPQGISDSVCVRPNFWKRLSIGPNNSGGLVRYHHKLASSMLPNSALQLKQQDIGTGSGRPSGWEDTITSNHNLEVIPVGPYIMWSPPGAVLSLFIRLTCLVFHRTRALLNSVSVMTSFVKVVVIVCEVPR